MPDDRPIGVFDSGVGGLTVLRAIHERLPRESTVYLGDLARCPYGTRTRHEVGQFAVQIGDYLVNQGIKLLVVACNTATAAAFEDLVDRYPVPVLGVVAPGAREALRRTRNGRIGVVATEATVASRAYSAAILAEYPEALVLERAASWLVPLVERGPLTRSAARRLAPILLEMREANVDTLILGCTHFPLVRGLFEQYAGVRMQIVDSAETTARQVETMLNALDMRGGNGSRRLLVTGPAEAFAERARLMFHASPLIETVDLALDLAR